MPDYKQGKIYTVRCKTDDTLIYVGCTTELLSRRMSKHKYGSINKPTICFYQYRGSIGFDWFMIWEMDTRGEYRFSSLVKQKIKVKICFVIHIAGEQKLLFYFYLHILSDFVIFYLYCYHNSLFVV